MRAGANVPLAADRAGLWGSYFEQQTPGYVDNAHTGARDENDVSQRGGRLALLWQIDDACRCSSAVCGSGSIRATMQR